MGHSQKPQNPGNATRQRDRKTPEPGSARKQKIGETEGGNENRKTRRCNKNRRKTRPGKRSEEDATGKGKAPELRHRCPPKKKGTEKTRRATGSRPRKTGVRPKKRARIDDVVPRTQWAIETTRQATGYHPSIGRDGRSPNKMGHRQTDAGGKQRATEKMRRASARKREVSCGRQGYLESIHPSKQARARPPKCRAARRRRAPVQQKNGPLSRRGGQLPRAGPRQPGVYPRKRTPVQKMAPKEKRREQATGNLADAT